MQIQNIEISHPNKILFPDQNITKIDLVNYYLKIADHMLPFIKDRPLTLRRYPHGVRDGGFYIKHIPDYYPEFIKRLSVQMRTKQETMKMASAEKASDLSYFANQAVIELHMSLSKISSLEEPDQMVFDFDPSNDLDFDKVRVAAFELKSILDKLGVVSFVKTTGSKGLHVHIPLKPSASFKQIKEIASKVANKLHDRIPNITTLEQRKINRGDKVFIDILRNDYAMTVVAPFSVRGLDGAPVATPIVWSDLLSSSINSKSFNIMNIFNRLDHVNNPWKDFESQAIGYTDLERSMSAL